MTSIHFPHPREDFFCLIRTGFIITSIHFPHPREDQYHTVLQYLLHTSIHFPHPREDQDQYRCCYRFRYFNPLPSSEGTDFDTSIHFPHPREDGAGAVFIEIGNNFNPLPSSEGRRYRPYTRCHPFPLQSTSLIRGKTSVRTAVLNASYTSIHFPHPREDQDQYRCCYRFRYFNPLPSSEGIHFPHPREDGAEYTGM